MEMHDRGAKKWTSLMLPEHVEALKAVFAETDVQEKPILDEQQMAEIDFKLQLAITDGLQIETAYFQDGAIHTAKGKLLAVEPLHNRLRFHQIEIKLDDVIAVHIV
jgi:hypothetical protein